MWRDFVRCKEWLKDIECLNDTQQNKNTDAIAPIPRMSTFRSAVEDKCVITSGKESRAMINISTTKAHEVLGYEIHNFSEEIDNMCDVDQELSPW